MTNTVTIFKVQQEKAQSMLEKLSQFVETGRAFGLVPNPVHAKFGFKSCLNWRFFRR